MTRTRIFFIIILFCVINICGVCTRKSSGDPSGPPVTPPSGAEVEYWLTKADQSVLLQKQLVNLVMNSPANNNANIDVDSAIGMQSIDGFGYTMTGGSAYLINRMGNSEKAALLNEIFGSSTNSIGVSYLRVSIGASDLSPTVFSYDDMPTGQTDPALINFSLSQDTVDLIPVLKQVLQINPSIKIMGSPWSPPVWM